MSRKPISQKRGNPHIRNCSDMPTVFRARGIGSFFYSNEGSPREPIYIQVERDCAEAKFSSDPTVRESYNDGCDARTMRALQRLIEANRSAF